MTPHPTPAVPAGGADENWRPLGWQTVPKEPTHVMLNAAYRRMRMDPSCAPFSKRILLKAWDAMLESAPSPPDQQAVPTEGVASLSPSPVGAGRAS